MLLEHCKTLNRLALVNTDHKWQKPPESSFFVHKLSSYSRVAFTPRYCKNGKCIFIHWRRWLPLRHRRTNAFVYHPNFLIYGVEYLHFRSRDSTCRRWYRHFRRRDLLLFTCAGGGEVGACVLALGGCSLSQLWRTRLGCHLGLGRGWLHNSGLILPFPWFTILAAELIPHVSGPEPWWCSSTASFTSLLSLRRNSSTSGIEKGNLSKPEQDRKNWSLSKKTKKLSTSHVFFLSVRMP